MKRIFLILAIILTVLTFTVFISSCGKGTEGLEFVEINEDELGVRCGEASDASEIVIPKRHDGKKVSAILSSGFAKCENLTSITIPKTVTKIEMGAFYGCKNLESVYFNGKINDWCNIDFAHSTANPMSEAEAFYSKGKEITKLKLKDISIIKPYTFFGFDHLVSFKADDTLEAIGENAFAGCVELSSVELPSSLVKLDKLCFATCEKLTEITIPANTSQIHALAFYSSGVNRIIFENTEKWFTASNEAATKGDKFDVTNPEQNAKILKKQGTGYIKRVLPTT